MQEIIQNIMLMLFCLVTLIKWQAIIKKTNYMIVAHDSKIQYLLK